MYARVRVFERVCAKGVALVSRTHTHTRARAHARTHVHTRTHPRTFTRVRTQVLVTSVSPLQCELYYDGLVRLCASKYEAPQPANYENVFSHLTNWSLNKNLGDKTLGSTSEEAE